MTTRDRRPSHSFFKGEALGLHILHVESVDARVGKDRAVCERPALSKTAAFIRNGCPDKLQDRVACASGGRSFCRMENAQRIGQIPRIPENTSDRVDPRHNGGQRSLPHLNEATETLGGVRRAIDANIEFRQPRQSAALPESRMPAIR